MACRKRVKCHDTDWIAEWCPTASDPSAAVVLSHVSHAFRQVVLATASLWSTIGASHVKTLAHKILLGRAGRVPLTVAIDIHPPWSLSFMIEILTWKRATIRHLWLPGGYSQDTDGLFQRLCYPAAMESLHLDLWGHRNSAPLQQYDLHRLVTLSLAGPGVIMPGPFTYPLLQLTKLALSLYFLEPVHVSRVLDLLSSTPALAELMISFEDPEPAWNALQDITPDVFSGSPIVFCSLLERIKMIGSLACMLTLLYHLRPATACHIDLSEDVVPFNDSGVLVRFFQGHPLGQGIVAVLAGPGREVESNVGWQLQYTGPHSSNGSTIFKFEVDPVYTLGLIRTIRWDGVRELSVEISDEHVADDVFASARISGALASVTVLGHHSARSFCDALHSWPPDKVPFPALERVVLCSVDMSLLEHENREGGLLLYAAEQRATFHVHYVDQVVLRECIFRSAQDLELLRQRLLSSVADDVEVE